MSEPLRIFVAECNIGYGEELRLAAIANGALIGTAAVMNVSTEAALLCQVHVVEAWRRRGFGRELVESACGQARISGCVAISVLVLPGGPRAFWTRIGFTVVHVEGDKLIMSRRLSSTNEAKG